MRGAEENVEFVIEDQLEQIPCDLCGQSDEEFLYTKEGTLTHHPFRLVRCKHDGFLYLNPRLSEEAITRLYDRAYYNGEGFDPHVEYEGDLDHDSGPEKMPSSEELVKIVEELVAPPARLLDFGCGLGDLVLHAQRHGYQADGFEISEYARGVSATKTGTRIFGQFDQIPESYYDVVTAIEVLEHAYSPSRVLGVIQRALRPGGVFYYTTENFDGFYNEVKQGKTPTVDSYVVPEGHICFYSTPVITSFLRKANFSKVVAFEPKVYRKSGRAFKSLKRWKLIQGIGDRPENIFEKALYYGALRGMRLLGIRQRPLPVGIK